jgi:epoxyqueuosine reductase
MTWIGDRFELRKNPQELLPGAMRAICFRMNYLQDHTQPLKILEDPNKAYVSRYALGRDYHKLMRRKLAKIAEKIQHWSEQELHQRPFVDSAPVLEKPLAYKAGLGWVGKNTLLLTREGGSWFFLGEILTSLELPVDEQQESDECGKCKACMTCCPTDAFPEPYVLDARKCISYLTIEYDGPIPMELRKPMGNRVFGCDDCQLVCPWNREAAITKEDHFTPRHQLESSDLVEIFQWTEAEFEEKTAGSPIRRAGYEQWQRNLAIGLGNGPATSETVSALKNYQGSSSLVKEHIEWAINQLEAQLVTPLVTDMK